jgi:hypothetical protein
MRTLYYLCNFSVYPEWFHNKKIIKKECNLISLLKKFFMVPHLMHGKSQCLYIDLQDI